MAGFVFHFLPTQWGGAPKGRRGAHVIFITETTSAPPPAFGHLPHCVGEGGFHVSL